MAASSKSKKAVTAKPSQGSLLLTSLGIAVIAGAFALSQQLPEGTEIYQNQYLDTQAWFESRTSSLAGYTACQ
jgi:hypothetical protein